MLSSIKNSDDKMFTSHKQNTQPLTVPTHPGSAELSIKKSTFLAQVHPWEDATGVKSLVQELRAQHFKARHVAWAFVIGSRGKQLTSNF